MTDPMTGIDKFGESERGGPWTERLVLFLRVMAVLLILKGVSHWGGVVGIGDGPTWSFEAAPLPWKNATVFFAVLDLVAGVGLWLAAAWGAVVWLTASISMAAVELFFPQVFGGWLVVVFVELAVIFAYVGLTLLSGGVRP